MGAHRAGHRDRLRGADAVGRQPAAAGLRRRRRPDAGCLTPAAAAGRHGRPARRCATRYRARKHALFDTLRSAQRAAPAACTRVLRQLARAGRRDAARAVGRRRLRRRLRAGGGRRLRPRRAVSLFRRRRAAAAARRHAADADPSCKRSIEGFIGSCWDAGPGDRLQRAHRRRVPGRGRQGRHGADLAARGAAGRRRQDAASPRSASASAPRSTRSAFFVAKTLEMRQRHNKFENTPYSLEPNCKESPGGLRDLQMILWVAKAAGFGKRWDDLAQQRPGHALRGAADQAQRGAAEPDPRPPARDRQPPRRPAGVRPADRRGRILRLQLERPTAACARASEALMRRYYWAAKAVTQLNQILLLNIEERLQPAADEPTPHQRALLREGRHDRGGQRRPVPEAIRTPSSRPSCSTRRPSACKGLSARTLRALYNARSVMDAQVPQRPGQPRRPSCACCCSRAASPTPCG